MGEFSADWLALREPYDHAARRLEVVDVLRPHLEAGFVGLELAAGTGSGVRWLNERLPGGRWTLVDHDAELLSRIPASLGATRVHDLEHLDALDEPADLVTCQALLDLVSDAWLVRFADWLTARRVPFLGALSVDGRVEWSTATAEDEAVQLAFRAHQLTDRGFGVSPGPKAGMRLVELLVQRGFAVTAVAADWVVEPGATAMLGAMIDGTAQAAGEMLGESAVADWRATKHAENAAGTLGLRVGHVDLAAVPRR